MASSSPYEIEEKPGYAIVYLTDSVDMSCSPQARKVILNGLQQHDHLVVDLSKVEYIDSSGVAVLVEGFQVAQSQGRKFSLLRVSEGAMNVLKLARLEQVFSIYDSEEALQRAQAPS